MHESVNFHPKSGNPCLGAEKPQRGPKWASNLRVGLHGFPPAVLAVKCPAYDSLSMECIAVVDGDMYGLSLDHLLGEEQ